MLRPHVDVATAQQAMGQSESDRKGVDWAEAYLDTHRGTKGGRQRYIPIDDALGRHAITYARHVAKGSQGSVSDPNLTLVQALRRLRYVMERFGITRRDLRVVPHGLRHQFAASRYTAQTGALPPVAGGKAVPAAVDAAARIGVSALLGHGRTQIASAYLGSSTNTHSSAWPEIDASHHLLHVVGAGLQNRPTAIDPAKAILSMPPCAAIAATAVAP